MIEWKNRVKSVKLCNETHLNKSNLMLIGFIYFTSNDSKSSFCEPLADNSKIIKSKVTLSLRTGAVPPIRSGLSTREAFLFRFFSLPVRFRKGKKKLIAFHERQSKRQQQQASDEATKSSYRSAINIFKARISQVWLTVWCLRPHLFLF